MCRGSHGPSISNGVGTGPNGVGTGPNAVGTEGDDGR